MIGLKGASLFLLATLAAGPAAAADCRTLVAEFDSAVAAKSLDGVRRATKAIVRDAVCGERAEEFRLKQVSFLLALAEDKTAAPQQQREALAQAEGETEVSGSWKTAAAIGDAYFRRGERADAFAWYERSLSFIVSRPSTPATRAERQALLSKAGAAKSADDENAPTRGVWRQSHREMDGALGGIYSPALVRGAAAFSVPLPVRFFTNEARFTPDGEAAVEELAKAAIEQNLTTMTLVGHADPRGTDAHNLDLSKRRVEAVQSELQRRGVRARISVSWKGAREPFDASVLPYRPSQEEVWGLDRRVEWIRGGQE